MEIVLFAICHVVSNNREGGGVSYIKYYHTVGFCFVADARIGLAD